MTIPYGVAILFAQFSAWSLKNNKKNKQKKPPRIPNATRLRSTTAQPLIPMR